MKEKMAAQKFTLQRPNLKYVDGGNLQVFVLRRKFQATAILQDQGDSDGADAKRCDHTILSNAK